ncbi:MAG: zf-HC2 domain-containing protein [Planctomycetota bacterium]
MDERTQPAEKACTEIRGLMLAEAERPLSEFEVRRIEQHVGGCGGCRETLGDEDGPAAAHDRLLREIPVDLPTEEDWRQLGARIRMSIAGEGAPAIPPRAGAIETPSAASAAAAPPAAAPSTPRSRPARGIPWWKPLIPLAATILLCFLVIQNIARTGMDDGRGEPVTAEVLELPEGSQSIILTPEEEDGGIMIFVTSG